jgi:hypothetical protein
MADSSRGLEGVAKIRIPDGEEVGTSKKLQRVCTAPMTHEWSTVLSTSQFGLYLTFTVVVWFWVNPKIMLLSFSFLIFPLYAEDKNQ